MGTKTDTNPNPLPDQANWTEVFYDGFNDGVLNTGEKWPIIYGGSRYWNKAFTWDRRDVVETGDEMVVSAAVLNNRWTAGGITTMRHEKSALSDGFDFTFGRVEIRAAIDAGKGTGPAMLLWPFDNSWPPEIDLVETPNGQRLSVWFTNHWRGENGEDRYHSVEFKSVDGTPYDAFGTPYDGKVWHTYTLDWLPEKLIYYIDGVKLYETPPGETVSAMPMSIALQMFVAARNDSWYGGGPDRNGPSKVDLHVDYVRVYESAATSVEAERGTALQTQTVMQSSLAPSNEDGTLLVREAEGATDGGPLGLTIARAVRAERVAGTPADEVLAGGAGPDVFIPGGGRDRVLDFRPGTDRLLVEGHPEQVKTFFVAEDGQEVLMVLHGTGPNLVALPGVSELDVRDVVFA